MRGFLFNFITSSIYLCLNAFTSFFWSILLLLLFFRSGFLFSISTLKKTRNKAFLLGLVRRRGATGRWAGNRATSLLDLSIEWVLCRTERLEQSKECVSLQRIVSTNLLSIVHQWKNLEKIQNKSFKRILCHGLLPSTLLSYLWRGKSRFFRHDLARLRNLFACPHWSGRNADSLVKFVHLTQYHNGWNA